MQAIQGHRSRVDGETPDRLFGQARHFQVAVSRQCERSWDRRRRHDQDVDAISFFGQRQPLMDAEAMLFIDDRDHEVLEFDSCLKQCMGPDKNIDVAGGEPVELLLSRFALVPAGENFHADTRAFGQRLQGGQMLPGENFGGRHHRCLTAALDGAQHREQGDDCLAAAHIALQQAQHGAGRGQIATDFAKRRRLRVGKRKRQGFQDRAGQHAIALQAAALRPFLARAHDRKRQLVCQQFIVGESRAGRRLRIKRRRIFRCMRCGQRGLPVRPFLSFAVRRIEPFGKIGDILQRLCDRAR